MKDLRPSRSEIATDRVDDFLGVLVALDWLRRRRRALFGIPAAVTLAIVLIVLVIPSRYTSSTVILPQAKGMSRLPSGLSGIAGQLGLSLPSESGQSPQFYAE